jgi:type I restriction enzyme M protein
VFTGAGVKTVVLFFEKGTPTRKVWYYQLNPGRNLGKTNPLNENDLKEFETLYALRASAEEGPETENSWNIDGKRVTELAEVDLSVKNPNKKEEAALRDPQEILHEMRVLDEESADILNSILELI